MIDHDHDATGLPIKSTDQPNFDHDLLDLIISPIPRRERERLNKFKRKIFIKKTKRERTSSKLPEKREREI